jgi:hypothetical protein
MTCRGTNSDALSPGGCGSKYPKNIAKSLWINLGKQRGHTTRCKSIGLLEYIQGKITHAKLSAHGKRIQDEKHLLQHEDIFTSWKRYGSINKFPSPAT